MGYSKGLEYRETGGYALLAQLVEHGIRNAGVRCSSHLEGTTFFPKKITSKLDVPVKCRHSHRDRGVGVNFSQTTNRPYRLGFVL